MIQMPGLKKLGRSNTCLEIDSLWFLDNKEYYNAKARKAARLAEKHARLFRRMYLNYE